MPKSMTPDPLRTSPTAGVETEHSAYYRRLLSAGYKGHVQGMIGGATLYGSFGLAIGAIVGIPLMFVPIAGQAIGLAALLFIPALGGIGAMEGAKTFADIGSHAAIMADSAETNERRRVLLEQLSATDDPARKEEINQELHDQLQSKPMTKFFHWKTAIIGAAFGAAIAMGLLAFAPYALPEVVGGIAGQMGMTVAAGHVVGIITAGVIGSLCGAIFGVDREFVRRWLDKSESLVNDHVLKENEGKSRAPDLQRGTEREQFNPSIINPDNAATAKIGISAANAPTKTVSDIANIGRASAAPQLAASHA